MSTATELLRRALEALEEWKEERNATCDDVLIEEIRAFLAAEPKAEPEPVAWLWLEKPSKQFPVYLHPPRPEPARKPMTEEEIQKGVKRLKEMVGNKSSEVYAAFEVGIRVAEKYHGIGGGDE